MSFILDCGGVSEDSGLNNRRTMRKTIYDPAYRGLIRRLREQRRKLGLSQHQAAQRLAVGRTWLTRVEQCEIRLDVIQAIRICRVYGLSAPTLVRQLEGEMSEGDDPLYVLKQPSPCAAFRAATMAACLTVSGLLFDSLVPFGPMGGNRYRNLNRGAASV